MKRLKRWSLNNLRPSSVARQEERERAFEPLQADQGRLLCHDLKYLLRREQRDRADGAPNRLWAAAEEERRDN